MSGDSSPPRLPPDSPGSSVSTRLQDEYEEFLRYAVVIPGCDDTPVTAVASLKDTPTSHRDTQSTNSVIFTRSQIQDESRTDASHMHNPDRQIPQTSQNTEHGDITPRNQIPDDLPQPDRVIIDVEEEVYVTTIDPDMKKMETLMNQWCADMKRNVMGEFSQAKIRIIERNRMQTQKERETNAGEKKILLTELESLKELLHTYEQSISRKDQVISNLTQALCKQKEKSDMAKSFCEWKHRHSERKRECFTSALAQRHHERKITQKVLIAWRSIIVSKWRQRVEKACQAKAQEVCLQLTNEYEAKIASLNESLEGTRREINRLHCERDQYEEAMKKAFMRGVCALNLEAMNMFQPEDENGEMPAVTTDENSSARSALTKSTDPPPRIITSQGSRPVTHTTAHSAPQKQSHTKTVSSSKGKTFTAKISARSDSSTKSLRSSCGNPTLNPPMSSVVVERHLPINKETLGKATASKYVQPRPQSAQGGKSSPRIAHRKIAGQDGPPIINTNIQPIKVVD